MGYDNARRFALCQVCLKLAQWCWRRRLLNFVNVFSQLRNYLPLEKGWALHLNKLESPSPKNALCQVWLKLAQWFWKRRWKYEKFTDRQTDRQMTNDRWSEKLTWAFSSGKLKIKALAHMVEKLLACIIVSEIHTYRITEWQTGQKQNALDFRSRVHKNAIKP